MTLKGVAGIVLILSISSWMYKEEKSSKTLEYCNAFRQIQLDVRTCMITPDSARLAFQTVMRNIKSEFNKDSCRAIDSTYFVYPIRCYTPGESIGGEGEGYRPDGFDLFDMNVSGSHPAHDLFVKDKDRDNIDDRTWRPLDILAFTSGMVVAAENNWRFDSDLRGGNWIWIYDPCLDGLFYYAHNNIVNVQPGQWVNAGDKIAEMGRTGFNAYKKRSPTHLHMMYLKLDENDLPVPQDTYDWMLRATIKQ